MQRNTLLLTAALAVIASFMVGLNVGKGINSTQKIPSPTPIPTKAAIVQLPFTSKDCGITFEYPNNLKLAESSPSGVIFYDSTRPDLSIAFACQTNIPRPSLPSNKIEVRSIPYTGSQATVSAKLYHDTSGQNGAPIDTLIFHNPKKATDVWIAGYGKIFTAVLNTVKILP